MPLQYGTKRKIPPTKVLAGRGVLAYVDDVAIMVTDVDKWTDADVIQLLEESAKLGNKITAPAAVTHFFGETLGGAASQRKMIVEWMSTNNVEPTPRTTTMTDSALMLCVLPKSPGKPKKPPSPAKFGWSSMKIASRVVPRIPIEATPSVSS